MKKDKNVKVDKKNKIILAIGFSVFLFALVAVWVSSFTPRKALDPDKLEPKIKIAYMASKEFARLPEEEKEKYMSKAGNSRRLMRSASHEDRRAIFKNTKKVMRKKMKERMDKFFAMSKEEQNKQLDERIARMDEWRKAREARNNDPNNSKEKRPSRRGRANRFFEGTDSTTRAQMAEYRKSMRERRQQTQGNK